MFDGSVPLDEEADRSTLSLVTSESMVLLNKADLPHVKDLSVALEHLNTGPKMMRLSLRTGEGTQELVQELETRLKSLMQSTTDDAAPTRARHRELLQKV